MKTSTFSQKSFQRIDLAELEALRPEEPVNENCDNFFSRALEALRALFVEPALTTATANAVINE